ncbi:WGR domain-containing protein [Asticcacaulis sp. W401b]|uniref:WGR domain-containing protein n=1 Tax=Asticcacaulis sp. W401b TaxID=3388666 RepID=UPI0039707B6D
MTVQHLRRIDQARNMARSYEVSVQPGLFGDVAVVRHWGRIGTAGQSKEFWFTDEVQADEMIGAILRQKQRRGYELLKSP